MADSGDRMEVRIDFKCQDTPNVGVETIHVTDWQRKSVLDLKYAIQDAIGAPVCDQRLFHRGQQLWDDSMPLLRTYHRQAEAFAVEFLAPVDIPEMNKHIKVLTEFSRRLNDELLPEERAVHRANKTIMEFRGILKAAIIALSDLLCEWKDLRTSARRHYLVQERGVDILMEVFRVSMQLTMGNGSLLASDKYVCTVYCCYTFMHTYDPGQ